MEIAARALSPGINDPVTATGCLNWLGEALIEFPPHISNEHIINSDDDQPRLFFPSLIFERLLGESFGTLRHYSATNPTTAQTHYDILTQLRDSFAGRRRRILEQEIEKFKAFCKESLTKERYDQVFNA